MSGDTTGAPDPPGAAGAVCSACGEVAEPSARFCENCGVALPAAGAAASTSASVAAAPVAATDAPGVAVAQQPAGPGIVSASAPVGVCPSCGGGEGYDGDGFCLSCGVRSVRPRDRLELDLGVLAAVSDKGPRKVRNEDAFAVAELPDGGFAVSVCDGVSNIPRSDDASQGAADAAVAVLGAAGPAQAEDAVLVEAAAAASLAVVGLARSAVGGEPPSCTFLAAVYRPQRGLSVGWLGDCRAYVLTAAGTRRLTTDHSWGTEAVASGALTQAQADRDERSHAITRWLGADASGAPIPDVVRWTPDGAAGDALLVACSDGCWNYVDTAEELAELVLTGGTTLTSVEPLDVARRLTQHAIDGGGHDNITVVVARLEPGVVTGDAVPVTATTIPTEPT